MGSNKHNEIRINKIQTKKLPKQFLIYSPSTALVIGASTVSTTGVLTA